MLETLPGLQNSDFPAIYRNQLTVLQVNLGYLCNLSCTHCHVNAGPKRTELMSKDTMQAVLRFIDQQQIRTLDLTGGAPEMNPHFRYLVRAAFERGLNIIDRSNLVILMTENYEDLAEFLAAHQVDIVASLPCYLENNVDQQRGKGTFAQSIAALQKLNRLGYGGEQSDLILNLVFNPQGPVLPPPQQMLEARYKQHLGEVYGVVFNQLLALTNLPIQRFGSMLLRHNQFDQYLELLKANFYAPNLERVMCKNTLSIDWQGFVYDCDFNQMLGLPLANATKIHISDMRSVAGKPIATLQHCYACTAGQGSSCGGALA